MVILQESEQSDEFFFRGIVSDSLEHRNRSFGNTIVNGSQAVVYLWYDNEFGYSCQVHRILEQMAGIRYATYPKTA